MTALLGTIFQGLVPSTASKQGLGGLAPMLAGSGWETLFLHLVGGSPEVSPREEVSHGAAAPDVSISSVPYAAPTDTHEGQGLG